MHSNPCRSGRLPLLDHERRNDMNIDDGKIYRAELMDKMRETMDEAEKKRFIEMQIPPTPKQMARRPYPKVGRNEPCPCGSGRKFKRCHLGQPVAMVPEEVR